MAETRSIQWRVNEGNDLPIQLTTELNTTGLTITARYRVTGGSGRGTQFASTSGASAGTPISMTLATASLSAGTYDVEFYADYGGASQTMLKPNSNESLQLIVIERFGV